METLFQNILTAGFHGSIVIAAVILLRLVLKKTPRKYICMLWLLAGLRLLLPFPIQSELSLQPDVSSVAEVRQQIAAPRQEILPAPIQDAAPEAQPEQAAVFTSAPVQETPVSIPQPEITPTAAPEAATDYLTMVPWLWFGIACCFGIYSLCSYLSLQRKVRTAIKIPGGWESDRIETAFILGFIRPKIYIPMGMSPKTQRYILAHERTHLEKGDHWFKMIGFVALALHWFNPLVWVAYVLLCKDIEIACDERVVQFMELEERKEYSAALLNCSTNRAHFAACPVAFGEVSVKERIKSVLSYKKPGFWISLVGVIAIVFVAVCLVTSPAKKADSPAAGDTTPETAPEAESLPVKRDGFAAKLSESEIAYTCEQALEKLKQQESYCLKVDSSVESTSAYYGTYSSVSEMRKHGENYMNLNRDGNGYEMGYLVCDGVSASNWGDAWVKEDYGFTQPDTWLDQFSPELKSLSFPEGTGVVSGDTVVIGAQWHDGTYECVGTLTFTFLDDGTLASFGQAYTNVITDEGGEGEVHYETKVTVQQEEPQVTLDTIRSYASQAVDQEELARIRREKEMVTEVPSNKTSYDKDMLLGSGQMGWQFMDGEWFFKFGGEDATATGIRLVVEDNGSYGNNTISSGTMTSGDTYFIEKYVDEKWTTVEPKTDSFTPIPKQTLSSGSSQSINWENNYGKLPDGFYRIGNYYTFTTADGKTDTQVCYAKFRLYDPEMDALLAKCRNGLSNLLASDSYHLMETNWMNLENQEPDDHYFTTEVWKAGADYLEELRYYYHSDNSLKLARGTMRRGGTYYDLNWVDGSCRNPVSDYETITYANEDNFQIWSWAFELFDAKVWEVKQEGNAIRVLEMDDFYDGIPYIETVFTFDNGGNLIGLSKSYVYDNGEKLVDEEMAVFDSTREEVGAFINSQDLSAIPAFSYAEDQSQHPAGSEGVRTKNFVNTAAKAIRTPEEAIERAKKDCTQPAAGGLEPGTNVFKAFYDPEARMWKVEFTASWDSSIYQAVYLNTNGITQMTVTLQ